ncbi:glycosyltransferase [Cytobacillus sp. IB215665]|uniref:glycosyltransferase n=1 Tax=Cytobacillus sp. IB215665 TaxID=3097357 RepID=UPI0039B79494
MMKHNKINAMIVVLVLFAVLAGPISTSANSKHKAHTDCYTKSVVNLKFDLRNLWIDHTVWTRNYIISAIAELEDKEKVLARLLQNQADIGNAIKPYYGEDAGEQLTKLLTEHIEIAGEIIDAAKREDKEALEKSTKEWYRNADDLAVFLSKANPNWKEEELKESLYEHLKLTADEVVSRLKKDWDADIAAFDAGEKHIIMLADVLAKGIIKQFPDQFNSGH